MHKAHVGSSCINGVLTSACEDMLQHTGESQDQGGVPGAASRGDGLTGVEDLMEAYTERCARHAVPVAVPTRGDLV